MGIFKFIQKYAYLLCTLLFVFWVAQYAMEREYPFLQQVHLSRVDDFKTSSFHLSPSKKRADQYYSGGRIDKVLIYDGNRIYSIQHSSDLGFEIVREYQQGDYFTDLTLMYGASDCQNSSKQGYQFCDGISVVSGNYYSNRYRTNYPISVKNLEWRKFIIYWGGYIVWGIAYAFALFGCWILRNPKQVKHNMIKGWQDYYNK